MLNNVLAHAFKQPRLVAQLSAAGLLADIVHRIVRIGRASRANAEQASVPGGRVRSLVQG